MRLSAWAQRFHVGSMPAKRWLGAAGLSLSVLLLIVLIAQRSPRTRIGSYSPTRSSAGAKSFDNPSANGTEPKLGAESGAFCNITGDAWSRTAARDARLDLAHAQIRSLHCIHSGQ